MAALRCGGTATIPTNARSMPCTTEQKDTWKIAPRILTRSAAESEWQPTAQKHSLRLFHHDTQKFLLAGTQEKFARLSQIDVLAEIIHTLFIDFYSALLYQALSFAF